MSRPAPLPSIPTFVEVDKAEGFDERSGHFDELLTDWSSAIQQEKDGFIAGRIFNHYPVKQSSGKYTVYPQAPQLRHGFKERAENNESGKVDWKVTFPGTFNCKVYAARMEIGRRSIVNAAATVDPRRDTLEILVEHSLIFKDEMWCEAFFKAGVWAVDLVATPFATYDPDDPLQFVPWDDYVNSNPIVDVTVQRGLFRQRTGKELNKMVIGRFVYDTLLLHPKILARVVGGFANSGPNPAKANLQTLAALFEMEEIVIANGIHDTGSGNTVSPTFIAGKHCLMVHSPKRLNLKAPVAGIQWSWTGYEQGVNDLGVVIDTWYERPRKCYVMEMELAFDLGVVAPSLGLFWQNVIS